jgi:hypothetical protein
MIVLLRHGFLETVESMIANSTPEMKLAWKEAPRFRRNSPTLAAMASALHLSDAEVDALFAEAYGGRCLTADVLNPIVKDR